jgi:hypothetical protein
MNRFAYRVEKLRAYWHSMFGNSPAFHSCMAISVFVLGGLYVVGLVWMVPYSIYRAFRN